MYYHKVRAFPNGDLMAIFIGEGVTPYGYGLARMDKDSRPIWTFSDCVHHDFALDEDGRIYTLTHHILDRAIPGLPGVEPPFLNDDVVVLSPDGKELRRVNILEAFRDSDFAAAIELSRDEQFKGDVLHVNAIRLLGKTAQKTFPFARAGQVLISMRSNGVLSVLDLDRKSVVWATRGTWWGQHDPDVLDDGGMLLFDNLGHLGAGGRSRVIEFDPLTLCVRWSYVGSADHPLCSMVRSEQQRLPNGNTLITESDGARLLEVTREGRIVWEFVNPVRDGPGNSLVPIVSSGERIARDALPFLGPAAAPAHTTGPEGGGA